MRFQNYTLWTLPTNGRLLSTWNQLSQDSDKLPSMLYAGSKEEYSSKIPFKV